MSTDIQSIVLVPRFTSYAGVYTYYTLPLPIRDFASMNLTAWRGSGLGTAPTILIGVQTSNDLDVWTNEGTPFDPNGEVSLNYSLAAAWLRLSVALGGLDPAFSCWVVGDFVERTQPGHGGGL